MPSGSLARPCPGHRVCSHWLRRPVTCSAKSLPDLGTSYPCPRAAWMKSAGAEIWGATEVPDPSLEAGVLPAAPPKARLWDQKPAKCRNRVGNAAGCYARAEASQGKHRTFVMPMSWTGGPQKVCLFNKKYKKREKKEKTQKKQTTKQNQKTTRSQPAGAATPWLVPEFSVLEKPSLSRVQVFPGAQQEPRSHLQPLRGGCCPSLSPGFSPLGKRPARALRGELLKRGCRHMAAPGRLCSPYSWATSCCPCLPSFPCLCPGLPTLSLCLPAHIPYQRPVCTLWHLSCLPLALSSPNLICFSLSVDQAMEME